MFGERQLDGQSVLADCRRWAEEGCVCPPEPPAPYIPTWDEATAMRVGWDSTPGESTSITFSFEKEWLGAPPHLYKLYGPAGSKCEAIWEVLVDGEKQKFMNEFGKLSNFEVYSLAGRQEECFIETDGHLFFPLKRNDDKVDPALRSISDFIEWDTGPWEIKAATFYYNFEEMKDVVTKMLPYVYVPPDRDGAGGFPADRRIQIHVVAPLKVEGGDGGPAANQRMRRSFRLIQLYFSDYTLLRLMFPQGPKGEPCSSVKPTEKFKCDVFTDAYNDVIDESLADSACLDEQSDIVEKKEYIVGIRSSSTYGDPREGGPQLTRVGFEIRKSESFEAAFHIAHRIALAINTMTADGGATVGIRHEREVDIRKVQSFAHEYRMKLRDDTYGHFCNADTQSSKWDSAKFGSTVAKVADPGNREDIYKREKLWKMLTLLLCSDWSKLVDVGGVEPSRNDVLAALDKLSQAQGESESEFRKAENEFRIMAAQYAFQLSEFF